jgi:hypothetical protein
LRHLRGRIEPPKTAKRRKERRERKRREGEKRRGGEGQGERGSPATSWGGVVTALMCSAALLTRDQMSPRGSARAKPHCFHSGRDINKMRKRKESRKSKSN